MENEDTLWQLFPGTRLTVASQEALNECKVDSGIRYNYTENRGIGEHVHDREIAERR